MSIRIAVSFLGLSVFLAGCAGTMQCDPDAEEAYMKVKPGGEIDPGDLVFERDERGQYAIPGEDRADRSRANPCLAQSPRIIDPPRADRREVREAQANIDLRVRAESLSQDDFPLDSTASTMRLRLGGVTQRVNGFDAGVMFQANEVLGDLRFNDGRGSNSYRPLINDPADTNVSEGWARWVSRGDGFEVKVGRQAVRHDNQRFVGSISHRQLEQTFNAASFRIGTGETWQLKADYLGQGITPGGINHPDRASGKIDQGSTLLDFSRRIGDSELGIYAHNMDFDDQRVSHQNFGIRLTGRLPWTENFSYRAELAEQNDLRGQGPEDGLSYHHFKLGQALDDWNWFVGQERLEGDGELGFQTPLATAHAFNGWADRFGVIPSEGLIDNYVGAGYSRWGWDIQGVLHQFRLDQGSGQYGRELGLRANRQFTDNLSLEVAHARYSGSDNPNHGSDDLRGDSSRSWLSLTVSY